MTNLEAKNWNNFYLGLAVAVLPFIGIPASFKQVLFLILGLLIALFSLARLNRPPASIREAFRAGKSGQSPDAQTA